MTRALFCLLLALGELRAIPTALKFANGTSNIVSCGSAASIDDMTAFTLVIMAKFTTFANFRAIAGKFNGTTGAGWVLDDAGSGNVRVRMDYSTTDLNYASSSAPLNALSWYWIVAAVDRNAGATNIVHLYTGLINSGVQEVGSYTRTEPAGTYIGDAAENLAFGLYSSGSTFGMTGQLAYGQLVNGRQLTAGEIASLLTDPFRSSWQPSGLWLFGANGIGPVFDRSGQSNHCANSSGGPSVENIPVWLVGG